MLGGFKRVPLCKAMLDSSMLIVCNTPSYLIPLLEIRLIWLPMNGMPSPASPILLLFAVCARLQFSAECWATWTSLICGVSSHSEMGLG